MTRATEGQCNTKGSWARKKKIVTLGSVNNENMQLGNKIWRVGLMAAFMLVAPITSVAFGQGNGVGKAGKANSTSNKTDHRTNRQQAETYIVVSKQKATLSVYAKREGKDTLLVQYPCCVGKNYGDKQKSGDMRTPESEPGKPFKVTQIQPAGNWKHDFKDGRGSILAYGKWFIRLSAKGWKGIGIHGSTNNEESVPGRGSEGCIRLKDKDIIHLKIYLKRK